MIKITNFFIVILMTFLSFHLLNAQSVGINSTGAAPNASAMLDVSSTNSGVLVPRMTQAQRNLIASPATGLLIYQTDNTPGFYYYNGSSWVAVAGASSSGLSAYGNSFQLATIADATVVGGADVPFSNNGPLSNVTHTAGTTTFTVLSAGNYEINYHISITAGVGSSPALAINGSVSASTPVAALVATGNISGTAILTLAAGDVVTLRNNSAVPLTLALAPSVGAQITFKKLD